MNWLTYSTSSFGFEYWTMLQNIITCNTEHTWLDTVCQSSKGFKQYQPILTVSVLAQYHPCTPWSPATAGN